MPGMQYRLFGVGKGYKISCDKNNNSDSCLRYGVFVQDLDPHDEQAKVYLKKSCALNNGEGCDQLKSYYKRFMSKEEIMNDCLKEDINSCHIAGRALFSHNLFNESFNVLSYGCNNGNQLACQEIKSYEGTKNDLRVQDEKRKKFEAQVEKERKEISILNTRCLKGFSKVCVKLASIYYGSGYLDMAIKYSNSACTQGNETGCKLQGNYVLEKNGQIAARNGEALTEQQKIANENQLNHQKEMQRLESNRQTAQALQFLSESLRTPAVQPQINCHGETKYNSYTETYESTSNCR